MDSLDWELTQLCRKMETNQRKESSKLVRTPNQSSDKPDRLSIALELLDTIVKKRSNDNRRYCRYCNVKMNGPIELHKKDCTWRRALELLTEGKD
jgi:hypothetical protein